MTTRRCIHDVPENIHCVECDAMYREALQRSPEYQAGIREGLERARNAECEWCDKGVPLMERSPEFHDKPRGLGSEVCHSQNIRKLLAEMGSNAES